MADLKKIQECIDQIAPLIEEVEALQPVTKGRFGGTPVEPAYLADDINALKEKVDTWHAVTAQILVNEVGDSNPQLFDFSSHWRAPIRAYDYKTSLKRKLERARSELRILLAVAKEKGEDTPAAAVKPPKVFFSHKTEDSAYAEALKNLINFIIGADGDKLFCSSIPGYGIKPAQDIIDNIKAQFDNYNLFVIIIHSPRYYKSAVCLNEMGAAWALNQRFCSFLTKDCRIDQLTGVIGKEEICISSNADEETLNAHLNSFKDDLAAFFGSKPIDQTKWEHERKQFVKTISGIKDADVPGEARNLFDTLYLPTFDTLFDLLDADHFCDWAYLSALDGNTILPKRNYEAYNKIIAYVRSRPKHKEYASWDSLIQNLGLLISDLKQVWLCHLQSIGDNAYTVERFYKIGPGGVPFNPNYDEDLKAYEEHSYLISDLMFELARIGNLILTRIWAIHPDYKRELGLLYIDDRVNIPDLVYREDEISDSPYPGVKLFIKERITREKHMGDNPNIEIDGYERPAAAIE